MSCVRYFNSTPHIVRFGSQDDKKEETWMLFWRNGVRFEISVSRSDIVGTRFEAQWKELSLEPKFGKGGDSVHEWVRRWEQLCDCVIFQCLDLLAELAPDGVKYWTTLREYIHTPGFKIKVIADPEAGDAKGQVTDGPEFDGAYEMASLPLEEVHIKTKGLQEYRSEDLRVMGREVNWKVGPHRVQSQDETIFALKCVGNFVRATETDELVNHSLDTIKNHTEIQTQCGQWRIGYPERIPQVLGYVTDATVPFEIRILHHPKDGVQDQYSDSESRNLIAGILLTDFGSSASLGDIVRDAKSSSLLREKIKENMEFWKLQTRGIVQDIHARGMACGALPKKGKYQSLISRWSIHIDEENAVWLDPSITCFQSVDGVAAPVHVVDDRSSEIESDFEKAKEMDFKAVEAIFDKWLLDEWTVMEAAEGAV